MASTGAVCAGLWGDGDHAGTLCGSNCRALRGVRLPGGRFTGRWRLVDREDLGPGRCLRPGADCAALREHPDRSEVYRGCLAGLAGGQADLGPFRND